MTTHLIRRLSQMFLVLFLSSVMIYFILSLVPNAALGKCRFTEPRRCPSREDIQRLKKTLGIDKPWYLQYVTWVAGDTWLDKIGYPQHKGERSGLLHGDWGVSWKLQPNTPVMKVIAERLPDTLRLMITVSLLSILIALPIGIFSAVRQYSIFDYVLTALSCIGTSLPPFWFALMLIALTTAARRAGLFYLPSGDILALRDYEVPVLGKVVARTLQDWVLHLILPVIVLTFINLAAYSRYIRASMLEVLKQDYVRTARAKGLSERVVVFKHALRNALIPLITMMVSTIPNTWGGALIIENIFNYKGLGWLYLQALKEQDWPIVTAYLLISAILIVLTNLLVDFLYTLVDPRIRLT